MKEPQSYIGATAATLGRAIAAGDLDPVSFAECLLERIEAQTSPIFLTVTRDRALAEATAARDRAKTGRMLSPLDGVPIAWKDLIDMAGETTTAASDLFRDAAPAGTDAPIVANAAAAGMVSLGKLNLTEFAYSGIGLNPHYGTPLNPRSTDGPRSPGGSSSGSGAAVAGDLAPIAIGTDTGGSVRIPAAFNGVTGYKSSEGRIDATGVFALSKTLDTVGPLAQTVEDCILADAVMRGAVGGIIRRADPKALRVFVTESVVLDALEPEVASNFEATLARLEKAGVAVSRGPLPEFAEAAALAGEIGTITAAEAYFEHAARVDGPDRDRIDRRVVARIDIGKAISAAGLIRLQRARMAVMQSLEAKLDGALIAMPTAPHVAPLTAPLEADDALFHKVNLMTLRNTAIGNFLNLPGVAIPNGTGDGGMPTSFLLSAPANHDERLLGAALALEGLIRGDAA
ncbi:amidase [Marimonas sp. MJW-29]|uniref:Amidase n=1 Tax=Sulfitobacter sediminis TaxID=3234186 RepID=A0ABV3RQK9_9RHOB